MTGYLDDHLARLPDPDLDETHMVLPASRVLAPRPRRGGRRTDPAGEDPRGEAAQEAASIAAGRQEEAERLAGGAAVPGEHEHEGEAVPKAPGTSSPGAGGGAGSSGTSGTSGTGPDPAPQQQDPDEGEHREDTPSAPAPDPASAADAADEEGGRAGMTAVPVPVGEVVPDRGTAAMPAARPEPLPGTARVSFDTRLGFSHQGPDVALKGFPADLVLVLRQMAEPVVGSLFAARAAPRSLVTAYLITQLGMTFEVDANTQQLVVAFRGLDARLSSLEGSSSRTSADVVELVGTVRGLSHRIEELSGSVEAAELSAAYVMTDRLIGLDTKGMTEASFSADSPKVMRVVERIRVAVAGQRKARQDISNRRAR